MCVDLYQNTTELPKRLEQWKHKSLVRGWKTLDDGGESNIRGFHYKPGIFKLPPGLMEKPYDEGNPHGYHVYLEDPPCDQCGDPKCTMTPNHIAEYHRREGRVPVWFKPEDVMVADKHQAACRSIRVTAGDWLKHFQFTVGPTLTGKPAITWSKRGTTKR